MLFLVVLGLILMVCMFGIYKVFSQGERQPKPVNNCPSKYPGDRNKNKDVDWYDVTIVGAGPAGSTCAYFLSQFGWKCLLLEKKKFPRDKYCGDAVCKTAIEILMEMGIYEKLIKEKKALVSDNGGMCSPNGLSYIGRSQEGYGDVPAAIACKRIHLDEAIAMAAKRMGVNLKENSPVSDAKFDSSKGLWTIEIEGSERSFKSRVLVCADGAPSRLGIQLGIIHRPPDSTCSRAYIEAGTHNFKADGVVFYNNKLLPGYSALFRHVGNDLNYCVYIIPGNPKCTSDDLPYWHDYLLKNDPNISRAVGSGAKMERMKAASLRLGGEKVTYDDHVIIVGDAAGMIDPMTGEGIHHAMDGGKLAAGFLDECLKHGNYDSAVLTEYHERWMAKFGYDFRWSMRFCQLLYRFPILLDAATAAVQAKGDRFLLQWADIMTGRIPKTHMFKPEFTLTITYQLFRLTFLKLIGQFPPKTAVKSD